MMLCSRVEGFIDEIVVYLVECSFYGDFRRWELKREIEIFNGRLLEGF